MCRRLSSPVLILAFALACVTASVPAGAQTPGVVVHVQAGWNLIPGRGSDLSDKTNFIGPRVYTLQPGDRDYEDFPAVSTTLKLGWGYWVYFTQNTDITLNPAGGSNEPLGITAPAGQYFMAGNPSSTQAATISGADAVYTYDPLNGYRSTTTLQPYQGAWVLSTTGGHDHGNAADRRDDHRRITACHGLKHCRLPTERTAYLSRPCAPGDLC